MASHQKVYILFAILFASLASGISGKMLCEDLPVDFCAFSVSTTGSRCVLEKRILTNGNVEYECQTSQVVADMFAEWMETDECIQSCGLDRMSVGISSDALVERGFAKVVCSRACQNNCPNVIDLFTNLAAGEGVQLEQVCEAQAKSARREMREVSWASLSANGVAAWEQLAAPGPSASL
eukprot:c15457_g1_i1 orf=154-693(-)